MLPEWRREVDGRVLHLEPGRPGGQFDAGRDGDARAVGEDALDPNRVHPFGAAQRGRVEHRQAAARHEPETAVVGPYGAAVAAVHVRQPGETVGSGVETELGLAARVGEQPLPLVAPNLQDARARTHPQRAAAIVHDGGDVGDREALVAARGRKTAIVAREAVGGAEPDHVLGILEDGLIHPAVDTVRLAVEAKLMADDRGDIASRERNPDAPGAVGERRLHASAREAVR